MIRLIVLVVLTLSPVLSLADTSLSGLKSRIEGRWISIACELRPTEDPGGGAPTPTYLKRDFTYGSKDDFEAEITIFADPACSVPMMRFAFAGDLFWHGENPAAPGAWSQDYVLNRTLVLTPLAEPMVAQLNSLPDGACGSGPFVLNQPRNILGQPCSLVRFVEGSRVVVDHDFLYVRADTPNMLFMGGKHVDGTGFYYPENRPTVGLQQPLIRVE